MIDPYVASESDRRRAFRLLMMLATVLIAAAGLAAIAAPSAHASAARSDVEVVFVQG